MSSCARSQPGRPGQASRPRRGWSARTPMSSSPGRTGLRNASCRKRRSSAARLLARVARRERFGRFGSREEIRVEARRQQEIGAIVAVLDLDPDRLNRPRRERHAVHGGALLGRQHRGRHPDAALGARHRPALVVGSCGGRRRARSAAGERTGDDRGCEPSPYDAVHIERFTQANRRFAGRPAVPVFRKEPGLKVTAGSADAAVRAHLVAVALTMCDGLPGPCAIGL